MNNEIKEILEIRQDCDYKKLSIDEIVILKDYITNLQECYCNRTDCSGRIKDSKKYDSLQQRIDKAIEYVKENQYIKIHEEGFTHEGEEYYILPNSDIVLNILQGEDNK